MDDKKWFVIRTNPRTEKKVVARLTELGIENYLPLCRQLSLRKDRKKWVDEVLFKSYVFVQTTEKLRQPILKVSGVVRFLFVGGQIAVVTEKEIGQIKIFCSFEDITIDEQNFESGDEVEIISGHLIGLRGRLKETTSGQKIRIQIVSLGCFATINIDKKDVKRITNVA